MIGEGDPRGMHEQRIMAIPNYFFFTNVYTLCRLKEDTNANALVTRTLKVNTIIPFAPTGRCIVSPSRIAPCIWFGSGVGFLPMPIASSRG